MRSRSAGAALAVPAWAWLLLFFVAPVAMVVWFSFGYKPGVFGSHANDILSFDRYAEAVSPTFFATFQNTLWVGVIGTVLCFVIGAPVAYWMAFKVKPQRRGILIALVLVPFWTNFLVRTIGWQVSLAPEGWLSSLLQGIGVLDGPLELLYTRTAVIIGVV
ncbi:MAG TPA: ABC transporter permease, partial [Microbacterium sp.]|uniref:ABC transporter permease n=1 Tax=Microbacterium sp. TaxID=51671 RepID=UPI002FACECE6